VAQEDSLVSVRRGALDNGATFKSTFTDARGQEFGLKLKQFALLSDGSDGGLKKSGKAKEGGVIVAINDICVEEMPFDAALAILKGVEKGSEVKFAFQRSKGCCGLRCQIWRGLCHRQC
jgi:hypothetical protein